MTYRLLADAVLLAHFAIVLFVVGGLVSIVAGRLAGWRWVDARAFRIAHLAAIAVVVAEAWLGVACPLTTLEGWLRAQAGGAGGAVQSAGFVAHWVGRLLYWTAPPWVFTAAYTLFGLLVVAAWWRFPPASRRTARPERPAQPERPVRPG